MSTPSKFYARVFALAVAALLGLALLRIFLPFAGPIAWAAFLAFLLFPINQRLRRRFGGRSGLAAGMLTILAPVVVLLPLAALSIEFFAQVSALLRKLQLAAAQLDIKTLADLQQFPLIAHINLWFEAHTSISAEQVQAWMVAGTRDVLERAASLSGSFFLGALSSLVGIALTLFLLFFFLSDGDAMILRARAIHSDRGGHKDAPVQAAGRHHARDRVRHQHDRALAGLAARRRIRHRGLPSPVVFGVLGALIAMLPVGGTAVVWIPATLWLFFDGRWGYGIFMLVWGVMLSVLDNVLKPLLISGRAPISALVVFLGVLGGIDAFGAIGIVAGPVILSLVLALIEFAEEGHGQVQSAP